MTASPDINTRIRSFLSDGIDRLPDDAYDTVRASVLHHRRRERWWAVPIPRPAVRRLTWAATTITAVLVLAAVAASLLPPGSSFGGGPSASSTPTSWSDGPGGTAAPSSEDWEYRLEVGRHRAESVGVTFTFAVDTTAWLLRREFTVISIHRERPDVGLIVHRPARVASSACASALGSLEGRSAEAMIDAIASIRGLEVLDRRGLSLGGLPAWYVEVRIPEGVACPTYVVLWQGQGPVRNGMAGDYIRVWGVDVGGRPLILESQTSGPPGPADRAALDALIETFAFEAVEP